MIIGLSAFLMAGCSLTPQKSGVEIMSYPTAKVFIDNKEAGMTPYKNVTLKPGEVEIRLEARSSQLVKKIDLKNNVNTVINWEFGDSDEESGGYLLFMEKTGDEKRSGLMISANPDKAAVAIDGEIKGFTPMRMDDIGQGDKQVAITFPGYKSINLYVKALVGYQLVIEVRMVEEKVGQTQITELELEVEPLEEIVESKGEVKIKETETGWLRVREASSSSSREIMRVKPGETYELLDEGNSWYKIKVDDEITGWISARYADKLL